MKREKVLLGMRAGARRVLQLFLPAMKDIASNNNIVDLQMDIDSSDNVEFIVDMMFPLNALNRSVTGKDFSNMKSVSEGDLIG